MALLRALSIVAFLGAPTAEAGKIYRHVDAQGRVYFSDRPISKKYDEEVKLKTINKLATSVGGADLPSAGKQGATKSYRLSLTSPSPNTTIPPGQRSLKVSASIDPMPESSVQYQLWMDGTKLQSAMLPRFTVSQLMRGTHQLQVKAVDSYQRMLGESQPVQIHVIRARVGR